MPARLEFDLSMGRRPASFRAAKPRRGDEPMRLLVIGDLAGARADREPLAARPTHRVDLDNLEATLQRIAPAVHCTVGGAEVAFAPRSLDDFHPDRLLQTVPLLQAAWKARERLADPAQFGQAAQDLLGGLIGRPAAAAPAVTPPGAAPRTAADAVQALIRDAVAAHIVPDAPPQQAALVAAAEDALARQLQELLHAPAFQALESTWRGVNWLVSNLELDESLQLHLFDVSRDELLADVVAAQGRLAETGLHRALADRWRNQPGAESWSLLAGLYRFGPGDTDIGLLAALGLIASQAGGPFVAEAHPSLAGNDPGIPAGWQTLRSSEAAPWIGLVAPRLLLRLPYGRGRDAVEAFAFEEIPPGPPEPSSLLWGAPALAVALLVGRAFSASGWNFEPGEEREIGDLPALTFERDGERELQPCAERLLGEPAVQAMLDAGIMPLASHKHRNAVTLVRVQSIAQPAAALAGLQAPR